MPSRLQAYDQYHRFGASRDNKTSADEKVVTVKYKAHESVVVLTLFDLSSHEVEWSREVETKWSKRCKEFSVGDFDGKDFHVDDVLVSGGGDVCVVVLKTVLQYRGGHKADKSNNNINTNKGDKPLLRQPSSKSPSVYFFVPCSLHQVSSRPQRPPALETAGGFLNHFMASSIVATQAFKLQASKLSSTPLNDCNDWAVTLTAKPKQELIIWNMRSGTFVKKINMKLIVAEEEEGGGRGENTKHNTNVPSCMDLFKQSLNMVFGTQDGSIFLLDLPDCCVSTHVQGHQDRVSGVMTSQ